MRLLASCTLAIAIVSGFVLNAERQTVPPETVSVCSLQNDPPAYNHKLIDVSALVSHGFEEFTLADPKCPQSIVWLEYGGTVSSNTVFCCGTKAGAPRPAPLAIDGIIVPLAEDAMFRRFDDHIRKDGDVKFRAVLRGRFFAGQRQRAGGPEFWGGYGHLGCCTLLVVQRVLSVDGQNSMDEERGSD